MNIELTHKKNDLRTKLYKELNETKNKFLNLPSKEDILYAGKEYDDSRNIVYAMEDLLEADTFEDEEIDMLLAKDNLIEEIYEEWDWMTDIPYEDIVNAVYHIAKSKDYDWG